MTGPSTLDYYAPLIVWSAFVIFAIVPMLAMHIISCLEAQATKRKA